MARPVRSFGGRRRQSVVAALTVAGLATVGLAFVAGSSAPPTVIRLSSGAAWLASPDKGYLTLIDGPAEQVVATVQLTPGDVSVTQHGNHAFVADNATGTVTRVDGATLTAGVPIQFGAADADLLVLVADDIAFVVDGAARTAKIVDPHTLHVHRTLSLAARPGSGQTLLTDDGTFWAVDTAGTGLTWFDGDGATGVLDAPATARLIQVDGRPVLVDAAQNQPAPAWVGPDSDPQSWTCRLNIRQGDDVQLLGDDRREVVFALVAQSGSLLMADATDQTSCATVATVGVPGGDFGPMVQVDRYLFIPDRGRGLTIVVDTGGVGGPRMVTELPLTVPGNDLELLSKDGVVFYNDRSSEKAGVLRLDAAGTWIVGAALRKFDPQTGEPEVAITSSVTTSSVPPADSATVEPTETGTQAAPPSITDTTTDPAVAPTTSSPRTGTTTRPPPVTSDNPRVTTTTTTAPSTTTATTTTTTTSTPPTPVVESIGIDGGGSLSDHSTAAFEAEVSNPSGEWHWIATTNLGPLADVVSAPHELFVVELAGGVTSISVTLTVGESEPVTEDFPVQPRAPVTINVDWPENAVWVGQPINVSVHVQDADAQPMGIAGHGVLFLNGAPIREGDFSGAGEDLYFTGIPLDTVGDAVFTAEFQGSPQFQPAESLPKTMPVYAVPEVVSVSCSNSADDARPIVFAQLNRFAGGEDDFTLVINVFDSDDQNSDGSTMSVVFGDGETGTVFGFDLSNALVVSPQDNVRRVTISIQDHTVDLPEDSDVAARSFPVTAELATGCA